MPRAPQPKHNDMAALEQIMTDVAVMLCERVKEGRANDVDKTLETATRIYQAIKTK